ncbi:MAG: GNAT family N-acetyltransferase [Firmicutes bacterium]|nr:GNAT family N-acetyltransferase [Bacillota bacterium]
MSQIFLLGFHDSIAHYLGKSSFGIQRAMGDIFAAMRECEPEGVLIADAKGHVAGYVIAIHSMSHMWWQTFKRLYWWKWTWHWLKGDYGIGLKGAFKLIRSKMGFAASQMFFVRKTPYLRGRVAQILSIAVHPCFRGLGIGQALLHEALSYLHGTQASFVKLEVRPSNISAKHLYEKSGFKAIASVSDSQGPWIVMLKDLEKHTIQQ